MDKENKENKENTVKDKKEQLENDLIAAEKEYIQLFENINKRRAKYLEQEYILNQKKIKAENNNNSNLTEL